MNAMRLRPLALLALIAVLAHCSQEQRATLSTLQATQEKLAAELKPAEVGLNLMNGRFLVVNIINSPLNGAPEAERAAHARKAAEIANGGGFPGIESVRVNFINKSGGFGVTVTKTVATYSFTPAELTPAAPPTPPTPPAPQS